MNDQPLTADGVPFTSGMTLWDGMGEEFPDVLWTAESDHSRGRYTWKADGDGNTTSRLRIADSYSTRAAALRARADRHVDRAFEAAGDGCWHTERWHLARASRCYRKAATQVAGEERARLFDRAAWAAETGRFDPPEPLAPEPAAGQLAFILEDDDAR